MPGVIVKPESNGQGDPLITNRDRAGGNHYWLGSSWVPKLRGNKTSVIEKGGVVE